MQAQEEHANSTKKGRSRDCYVKARSKIPSAVTICNKHGSNKPSFTFLSDEETDLGLFGSMIVINGVYFYKVIFINTF